MRLEYAVRMGEVTKLLHQVNDGDADASSRLMQAVYQELRQMADHRFASERPDHTLQPTALVNEAYLRLISDGRLQSFENRAHFFAAAAEAMRRILIDSARVRNSLKRGGGHRRVDLEEEAGLRNSSLDILLDVDDCLTRLAAEDENAAELVKLRLYAGLSVAEAGQLLGMPRSTAYKNWEFAKLWFAVGLSDDPIM